MLIDFNKKIDYEVGKLSREYFVEKETLESYVSTLLDNIFTDLESVMSGICLCIKNKRYMKKLKKLNRKYGIYH